MFLDGEAAVVDRDDVVAVFCVGCAGFVGDGYGDGDGFWSGAVGDGDVLLVSAG